MVGEPSREEIEIKLLLEGIFLQYGYDFRDYSAASIRRRILHIMRKADLSSISALQHRVLHEPDYFHEMLLDLTVTTSEMFRDPTFYRALRDKVVPFLRTYPTFKVWHAGCSTGEEVYSLAILLTEEGLYERATIYATDINRGALKKAREGIYPLDRVRAYTANYQRAGGKEAFSEYYTASYGSVRMNPSLLKNVVFAEHNLVTDSDFAETNLILCRNVLIYFTKDLQNKVLELFTNSLRYRGFLCLGSKETVRFLDCSRKYDDYVAEEKIFQKNVPD